MRDASNGYEAIAGAFTAARSTSLGVRNVLRWARRLPPGAAVLDIGCGNGIPISGALLEEGFAVYGIDASETLATEFRNRFPAATIECGSVENSAFFHRTFDGVVAWGLIFVLPPGIQRTVIGKVARALNPQGRFLFTSPKEPCSWTDNMTGLPSTSLGQEAYAQELAAHGLALVGDDEDEGQNYYYFAEKR